MMREKEDATGGSQCAADYFAFGYCWRSRRMRNIQLFPLYWDHWNFEKTAETQMVAT